MTNKDVEGRTPTEGAQRRREEQSGESVQEARLRWWVGSLAIALSVISFLILCVVRFRGGQVRWTWWVIPLQTIAISSYVFFGWLKARPVFGRLFGVASIGLSLAVVVSEVGRALHR